MSHKCPDPGALVALLDLPADDERRRAAAACPRCDALLRSLDAFLAGDEAVPAAERAAAERHLAGVIEGLARADRAQARAPSGRGAARRRPADRAWRWGWAAGLAAAAGLAFVLVGTELPGERNPSGRLRGGQPEPAPAIAPAFTPDAGGGLLASWAPVPGAETYRLELFAADLDTLAVRDGLAVPSAVLAADLVEGDGAAALCRVRAYGGGRELVASALVPVTVSRGR